MNALIRLQTFANQDIECPHIHAIDMPFRLTSTWQDFGCEIKRWEREGELVAWAVFLPAWWNCDYAIAPALRGSELEREIFVWAAEQMRLYSAATGEQFWGSVEIFEETPNVEQTLANLKSAGYKPFGWSTLRFSMTLEAVPAAPMLPDGFAIRPLRGQSEVDAYVHLHRTAFGSEKMTAAWRARTLQHPSYQPALDLVVVDAADTPVGFCVCWQDEMHGQIEPLGVLPDYQGLGLGRALEQAATHILWQHGVRTMHVDHTSFNEAAIALSKQTGFVQTHNALRYYVEIP